MYVVCNPKSKKSCSRDTCASCFGRSLANIPEIVSRWSTINGNNKPINVLKFSRNKIWLTCPICIHDYDISALHASGGRGCPYCSNKRLCENINCKMCFEKSYASNPKSINWDYDNNEKTPRMTFLNQNCLANFKCRTCGHAYRSSPYNDSGCHFCTKQKLCEDLLCEMCFNNSFASHPSSEFWSSKNEKPPRQYFKSGGDSAWFVCECGHEFNALLSDISKNKNSTWCGYCSNPPKYLCDDENCMKCFYKSFASHPKAICWVPTNEKTPRQTFLHAIKPVLFCCETCSHKWLASPGNISAGKWCPACKNKTERILLSFLKEQFEDVKFNFKFDWGVHPDTNRQFMFDFVLSNIIIELDGDQHFIQVSKWKSPEVTRKRDLIRMKQSMENGYSTIRILQRDVYFNKYDWKTALLNAISAGQNAFLCENGEYDEMQTQLES